MLSLMMAMARPLLMFGCLMRQHLGGYADVDRLAQPRLMVVLVKRDLVEV
jgi:hypothetical protein